MSSALSSRGQALVRDRAGSIITGLKAAKADTAGPAFQKAFFDKMTQPADTKPNVIWESTSTAETQRKLKTSSVILNVLCTFAVKKSTCHHFRC